MGMAYGGTVEAAKAVVLTRTLATRRRRSEAFGPTAGYEPLTVTGAHSDAVLAFARTGHTGSGDRGHQPVSVPATTLLVYVAVAAIAGLVAAILPALRAGAPPDHWISFSV